jgi:nucleosome-remodeling factor subunit BPTF
VEKKCFIFRHAAPFAEIDEALLPRFELPPSSADLIISDSEKLFDALEVCNMKKMRVYFQIYEILRRLYKSIKLSPFLFEDFCAVLVTHENSCLLANVHISLLKMCLQDDAESDVIYLPMEQRESQVTKANF